MLVAGPSAADVGELKAHRRSVVRTWGGWWYAMIVSWERKKLASEVTAIINNEESAVYAKVTYVGLFSIQGEENLPLNEFAESNAPAIIFPYIREEIHNKMQKACLPKFLIIPPINIIALSKSSDSK